MNPDVNIDAKCFVRSSIFAKDTIRPWCEKRISSITRRRCCCYCRRAVHRQPFTCLSQDSKTFPPDESRPLDVLFHLKQIKRGLVRTKTFFYCHLRWRQTKIDRNEQHSEQYSVVWIQTRYGWQFYADKIILFGPVAIWCSAFTAMASSEQVPNYMHLHWAVRDFLYISQVIALSAQFSQLHVSIWWNKVDISLCILSEASPKASACLQKRRFRFLIWQIASK